jgi:membrane associated rhomboid family serine protease
MDPQPPPLDEAASAPFDGYGSRAPAPARRRGRSGVVHALVAANVAVFLLWLWPGAPPGVMAGHFLVSWAHLADGRVWVLVSSVFSHFLLLHLLINMVVLVSFGTPLARLLGWGRFLLFYLVAGAVGSLAHALTSAFLIGAPARPALGASSAVAGVLLLFSLAFPRAKVLLFFLIPLPAIVAALAFVAIDIWGLVAQIEGAGLPIGHGAHLGGALVGLLYFLRQGRALRQRAAGLLA